MRTADFYAQMFAWQMKPGPHSINVETDSAKGIQGHLTALGHEPHNYVTIYVEVAAAQAQADKCKSLGSKKLLPVIPLPDGGKFTWIQDPEGNTIGLLQKP